MLSDSASIKRGRLESVSLSARASDNDQKPKDDNLPGRRDTEDETEIVVQSAKGLITVIGPKPASRERGGHHGHDWS